MDALPDSAAAPIISPAYIELQREIVINADIWSTTARILSADLGFEGIIGIPGLDGPGGLELAAAAGAGINRDLAGLTPTPPLRNLTSAQPVGTGVLGGYGANVVRGDALPIVFSWPVLPGTLAPTDIAIHLNTGEVVTPAAAGLNPNGDYNERNVVVVFGEFGNRLTPGTPGAIYPVSVEIVADSKPLMLVGPGGLQSAVGLTAESRNPFVTGPSLLAARVSHFSSVGDAGPAALTAGVLNDGATLYQGQSAYRLRLMTTGGFSADGVSPMLPGDFSKFFQLQARDASGALVTLSRTGVAYDLGAGLGTVTVVGLAELGPPATGIPAPYYRNDNDNYIDIILNGDEAAIRSLVNVAIPTAAVAGYSDIYTPGGPGRTPTPGVTYTRPAAAQTLAISNALDQTLTVSHAAQQVAAYDSADGMPIVFRLYNAATADTVYTASSRQAADLLAQGFTEQGVPFSNEAPGPGKSAVIAFHSAAATDHIYTLDPAEIARLRQGDSGYAEIGAAFTGLTRPMAGAAPIHRFNDAVRGGHLYTPSLTEGFTADGYAYEGIAWYAADLLPGQSDKLIFDRDDTLDFTGTLTGNDTLLKQGKGTLILAANSVLTGGTQVDAGTLRVDGRLTTSSLTVLPGAVLAGGGVLETSVINAGTLAPGRSPGILTVTGSLMNSGTAAGLRVELDGTTAGAGDGHHDQVKVGGRFTAGGSVIPVIRGFAEAAATPFTPVIGQHFTILQAAGGVSGSFQSVTQPTADLPANARFDLTYGSDAVTLWVTPDLYAAVPGLTGSQKQVASALDKARPAAGTRDFTDRDTVYGGLYGLAAANLPALFDGLAGNVHAETDAAGLDTMRLFGDLLSQRTAAARRGGLSLRLGAEVMRKAEDGEALSMADLAPSAGGTGLWGRAVVGSGTRGGFDLDSAGFVSGIDTRLAGNLDLGMAFGYFRNDLDGGPGQATQDMVVLAGYGGVTRGRFFAEGSLSLAFTDNDSRRSIRLGDLERTARAEASGDALAAAITAGYRWAVGNLILEPAAGLRFDRTDRQGFSETGAGTLDLTIDDLDSTAVRGNLGLRAAWRFRGLNDMILEPELSLRWDHDFRDVTVSGRAWLDGASFDLTGEKPGRDAAILGAGITAQLDDRLEAYAQVDLEQRRDSDRQSLSGGVRWRFG